MGFTALQQMTQKELDQFKVVCNQLLSRTFVVRSVYRPNRGTVNNPDYNFLALHYEDVRNYLLLLDWDLRHNEYNGYFYVLNTDEANRCNLNKISTAIVLALRIIYDENQDRGLNQDVICTVRDVLEKTVSDYAILSTRPNMDEVKRSLKFLDSHSVIQNIEGKYNQAGCKFAILPTILTAVSSERLGLIVAELRKEEDLEDSEEDTAD